MKFNLRTKKSSKKETSVVTREPAYVAPIEEKLSIELQPEPVSDKLEVAIQQEPVIESVFPTAEVMAQKSSENWKAPSKEQILEKLLKEAKNGYTYASFYDSMISEEIKTELEKKGYRVEVSDLYKSPYFKIYW